MTSEIKNKYLVFPVNTLSAPKDLNFKRDSETVYHLSIKLDNLNPNFYSYVDVSRFIGLVIDISVEPEMKLEFCQADEINIDNLYHEPMRPQAHFTTKNGWLNDPNGLIYLDGIYHMFYQHNPAEPNWGNMHWGHAESRDLIHWEEKDISLFPDGRGAMFSGCAIIDDKNLLGKNDGDNKCALLFYTTTRPFCQYMSYSTDNFKTINTYGDKPIIPHIIEANRDTKVVFCDEMNCYIMVLYLVDNDYCIFKSDDLISWQEVQRMQLQGDVECPDIFMMHDSEGIRKWIIMGAHERYIVGTFENGKFIAEQSILPLHYGNSAYAGQSFSNLPNGRIVRMVWDRWKVPAFNFNGQMGIPMEMSLSKYNDTYYIQANPVKEIENIYKTTSTYNNVNLTPDESFSESLESGAYLLKLKGENVKEGIITVSIFGRRIIFDFDKNNMSIGDCKAPVSITNSGLDVTIVIDKCSMELFADGGKIYLTCISNNTVSDYNIPRLGVFANKPVTIDSVEINSLESIWNNK